MIDALPPDALRWHCASDALGVTSSAELEPCAKLVGQPRVSRALSFFADMRFSGYNLFAVGEAGVGKHSAVTAYLTAHVASLPEPRDWCYVSDFSDPRTPRQLELPCGVGVRLKTEVDAFIEDCRAGLMNAFDSEEFNNRRQAIEEEMNERSASAMSEVEQEAKAHDVALVRTPVGFALAPTKDGEILDPEAFQRLPESERELREQKLGQVQEKLRDTLRQAPRWQKEVRERMRALSEETAHFAVVDLLASLKVQFEELDAVLEYLDELGADVIANADAFLGNAGNAAVTKGETEFDDAPFARYGVNLLVGHQPPATAPVVYEDNPTFDRLVGAIEHRAQLGTLTTDFSLIRPGALHRANGGFLILDAAKVLSYPFTWEGLKQALRSEEIRITPMERALGLISTQSLEPQAIPLKVKVVLVGDRRLYYLLSAYDPEFADLFKVMADFDSELARSADSQTQYLQLMREIIDRNELRHFDASGLSRVLEESARSAGHTAKFSANLAQVSDLLREAHYEASQAGHELVCAADVDKALAAGAFRGDLFAERSREQVLDDVVLVDTEGDAVGQINGLAVISLGKQMFGRVSRITARVALGRGEVIDIEREAKLGGALHSKGVMILRGYLNGHYAADRLLSLTATLVFEQSYGGIDGDSASSAELYCLLSAIAGIPIQQRFAVTGSVNQVGEVQAIGGVNEKIEGFFDLCDARGLDGSHGVLIPKANQHHLMLAPRVVEAVAERKFAVYAVGHIDEGIELLTGKLAGTRAPDGSFPEGTFNAAVVERLESLQQGLVALSRRDEPDQSLPHE